MTDSAPPPAQATLALASRNPDVLTCIANLSNDEVFTPPELANQMLDNLEQAWAESNGGENIWTNSTVRFLDPFTKSGVFLREITKRLVDGLTGEYPDLQERVDHILTQQVYGIGITELTAMLARRSLYCSKWANGEHSIASSFDDPNGNIWFERTEHTWVGGKKVLTADKTGKQIEKVKDGKCKYCGAGQTALGRGDDLETHAYAFIHTDDIKARISELFGDDMQFDVIIGNPPYQIVADGAGQNVVPIYNRFVDQAMSLEPRFLSMVIPARWMAGGKGLDEFRSRMLGDRRIRVLADYPNSAELFPSVDIKSGICYFLWDFDNPGPCSVTHTRGGVVTGPLERRLDEFDVFVRDGRALRVLRGILGRSEPSLASLISARDPFGSDLTANAKYRTTRKDGDLRIYVNRTVEKAGATWIEPSRIGRNNDLVGIWKVLLPAAGPGNSGGHVVPDIVLGHPFVAGPNEVCSISWLVLGPLGSEDEAHSAASYLCTRFARFLVSLRKPTQHAFKAAYTWVPRQTWDRTWTDEELYAKYDLSDDEIDLIESMIRPMDLADA